MSTQRMPTMLSVARNQFGVLIGNKYVAGLAGFMALSALPPHVFGVFEEAVPPWDEIPRAAFLYITMIGSGAIAGVIAWFNETPRNRRYHWSMPIRREQHDVIRIATGAIWLTSIIAVLCVASWFGESELMREQWLRHAPTFWAGIFLVALLMYLLATIPTLLSSHPFVWMLGFVFIAFALASKPVAKYAPALATAGEALFSEKSRASLGMAIGGGIQSAPWTSGRERYRVYLATAPEVFREHRVSPARQARLDANMRAHSDLGTKVQPRTWIEALVVWYTVAILGIALALRRRPDV